MYVRIIVFVCTFDYFHFDLVVLLFRVFSKVSFLHVVLLWLCLSNQSLDTYTYVGKAVAVQL